MKILIVGAGVSGLVALKELRDVGFDCVCVEADDGIGGVFRLREVGGAYDSTRLTVSNYFMAYSSFPLPADEPRVFWDCDRYVEYLERFVDHFGLRPHIRLSTRAEDIRLEGDGVAATLVGPDGSSAVYFDAVVVATGTHQVPKLPELPGSETFPGQIVHAVEYRNAAPFAGKRVVCIGIGETGADVAHEISQRAASAVLSIRHYPSIIERWPRGDEHTSDAYTFRVKYLLDRPSLQDHTIRSRLGRKRRARTARDRMVNDWGIRSGGLYGQWFTKSDVFFDDLADGRLQLNVGGIERIEGSTVVFRDGARFEADAIVCSTGYASAISMGDLAIDDVRDMYKHMIHPDLGTRITFIGWARPDLGGVPTCSELQVRYLAQLLTGRRTLPADNELRRLIEADREAEERYFNNASGLKTAVPYTRFCDGLARLIGCHPLGGAKVYPPDVLLKLLFGSLIGAHYRLVGPDADPASALPVIRRLPIVIGRREALEAAARLGVSRLPFIGERAMRRASKRAQALFTEYLEANGGTGTAPGAP